MKPVRIIVGVLAAAAASGTLFLTAPADAARLTLPVSPSGQNAPPGSPERAAQRAGRAAAADVPGAVKIVRDGITLLHRRTSVSRTPVTGRGATRSDFDGDGRDDIAADSGAGVLVSYTSAPVRDRLTAEIPGGTGCTCFGDVMVTGNFNGDKYDDLAVGDNDEPDLNVMGYHAGAVWVFLGGPSGLRANEVKHVNQSTSGVPGTSAEADRFAGALAAGDITGDGRDELVVGLPLKKVAGKKEAGAAIVLKGSSGGIVTSGAKWIDQNTGGVPGGAETGDHFGSGLAVGRINKDKYQDLAIGAAQENDGQAWTGSGSITQFWGTGGGVSFNKVTAVGGDATFAVAEPKDAVVWYIGGQALAIADTSGDGYGEIVVGAPAAQANWNINGGVVVTFPVGSNGVTAKGIKLMSQRDKDIAGASESDDYFGASIAAGDVTGDGIADVLVGVPGEDLGSAVDAGSVVLLRGSRQGLTATRSITLTQSSNGVPDAPERNDTFGAAVAVLNLNGANGMDAAIGAPGETVSGDQNDYPSGTVTRLYGGSNGIGGGNSASGRSFGVTGEYYGYLAHQ